MGYPEPIGAARRSPRRIGPLLWLVLLAAVPSERSGATGDPPTSFDRTLLTGAEQAWLTAHPIIYEAQTPESSMAPLTFRDQHGIYTGITADYVALIAQRLGVKIEDVDYPTVEAAIAAVTAGRADFTGSIVATPERARQMNLSEPYMLGSNVFVVRSEDTQIRNPADLAGHRIAIERGIRRRQILVDAIPNLRFVEADDATAAVRMVRDGQADAYVGPTVVVKYLVNQVGGRKLQIRGPVYLPPRNYVFGVRPDALELVSIINRALASLTETERHAIESRWSPNLPEPLQWRAILAATWPYLAVLAGIVAVVLAWNQSLRVQIRHRRVAEQRARAAQEVAESATRAKSEFVATVGHEIRNPMNAISGMAHHLTQSAVTEQQRAQATKLQRSSRLLLDILNDLLDLSKIEAGKLEIEDIPFSLSDVLEHCGNLLGQQAGEKGLELLFAIPPAVPTALQGDPLRLGQILLNLGNNAIKFTPAGAVTLRIEERSQDADGVRLRFSVSDTGVGMSAEQVNRLFQPFTQGDRSISRRFGGTGLGLAISQQLVSRLGGGLEVHSSLGAGTQFSFELHYRMQTAAPSSSVAAAPSLRGARMLIVNSSSHARVALGDMANGLGLRTDTVADGAAAVQASADAWSASRPYEVALISLKLEGMSALECARGILGASAGAPPAILFTAPANDDGAAERVRASTGLAPAILFDPVLPWSLYRACAAVLAPASAELLPLPVAQREESTSKSLLGVRLLLVEDDEINREVAGDVLSSAGAQVSIARDGRDALNSLTAGDTFDAVLMDYNMPVMDGYEATRAIRALPRWRDLPVIAISADTLGEGWQKAQAAGMTERISKPIDVHLLSIILQRCGVRARGVAQPAANQATS
jgi:signal transduction histidine kinase/DNA-binding response OmpR family regulator